MSNDKLDLKRAYSLKTPQDSVELYRDWASSYDVDFAQKMDYRAPQVIAATFAEIADGKVDQILDVGAGTGLVGEALSTVGKWPIDALDISPEMLVVAMSKGCYRQEIVADLTQILDIESATYGGVISAGTFTHGHVGPDALDELLRIARPGALFVLGVNREAYATEGFERKFKALAPQISDFRIFEKQTYGENGLKERINDKGWLAVFRKV